MRVHGAPEFLTLTLEGEGGRALASATNIEYNTHGVLVHNSRCGAGRIVFLFKVCLKAPLEGHCAAGTSQIQACIGRDILCH